MQIYFFLKICNFVLHGIQFIVFVYTLNAVFDQHQQKS